MSTAHPIDPQGERGFTVEASSMKFGPGMLAELGTDARNLRLQRVALFTDPNVAETEPVRRALDSLKREGVDAVVYDRVRVEPTSASFLEAADFARDGRFDGFISIGGGSVIDTAKAARLCDQLGLSFREFLAQRPPYPVATTPLVAMPTSAGTGSEVSGGSVISDPDAGTKNGIANANLRAQYALVDPLLTFSMPPSMTANTGIDALAQAIAGMVAHCRTPIGDAIALEAVRMMTPAIVAAYKDGNDAAARSAMACGSMMAGLTMNISDCTAEHALGQAIGGLKHVPHGLTIGLVLVETLERERQHVPEQLERVADAMGEPADGTSDGSRAIRAVRRVLAELDFPVLSSLGFTDSDVEQLADLALADYFITMSPSPWSKDEVMAAFRSALALERRAA